MSLQCWQHGGHGESTMTTNLVVIIVVSGSAEDREGRA